MKISYRKQVSGAVLLSAVFSQNILAQTAPSEPVSTLEPLVVTGSAVAEPLKDVPVRTEVIDRSLIQSTAARDLAQIIEYAPGIRVETTCSNCNTQSIQLLGLPQSYIAILSDGLPTISGLVGVYGIEQIPAGLIDRIEVVKGGGSTLYGPSAVAGVINLLPRESVRTGGSMDLNSALMQGDKVGDDLGGGIFGVYDWVLPEKI